MRTKLGGSLTSHLIQICFGSNLGSFLVLGKVLKTFKIRDLFLLYCTNWVQLKLSSPKKPGEGMFHQFR